MKKVLLVLRHTKEQYDSDTKYIGISKGFLNLGYEVYRTYIDKDKIILSNGKTDKIIGKMLPGKEKLVRNSSLYLAVLKVVREERFDLCYIRSIPTTPLYLMMVKRIKATGCKIMVEIPTYPKTGELHSDKFYRKAVRNLLDLLEKKTIKYITLYLLLGEKADNYIGCPAINIENGADIECFNKKKWKSDKSFHMVFIGKVARWHGVDRVIRGLAQYYKDNPDELVYFHIIGNDADGTLKQCRNLVADYNLGDYVLFEGPKYGSDADAYFDISDIAIASLGDHRRKINNISLLKIKEYMARGIPFVYSMDDNMLKENYDFCIKIPKDDSIVNIHEIVAFSRTIDKSNVTDRMRKICKDDMGWEKQISIALNYMEELRQ